MCASIITLARNEITGPSIKRHVKPATSLAIDATERVVPEATFRLVEVVA